MAKRATFKWGIMSKLKQDSRNEVLQWDVVSEFILVYLCTKLQLQNQLLRGFLGQLHHRG